MAFFRVSTKILVKIEISDAFLVADFISSRNLNKLFRIPSPHSALLALEVLVTISRLLLLNIDEKSLFLTVSFIFKSEMDIMSSWRDALYSHEHGASRPCLVVYAKLHFQRRF